MKKKLLSCLILFGVSLVVVGCGSDQLQEKKVYGEGHEILKCNLPNESEEKEVQATYLQVVKNTKENKIVETSLNLEFDYTDTLKDDKSGMSKKTMHSGLNLMCDAFEKQGYFDCYYSAEDYIYTITMGLDLKDFAAGADTSMIESTNLEDIKSILESQKDLEVSGCKIEKK